MIYAESSTCHWPDRGDSHVDRWESSLLYQSVMICIYASNTHLFTGCLILSSVRQSSFEAIIQLCLSILECRRSKLFPSSATRIRLFAGALRRSESVDIYCCYFTGPEFRDVRGWVQQVLATRSPPLTSSLNSLCHAAAAVLNMQESMPVGSSPYRNWPWDSWPNHTSYERVQHLDYASRAMYAQPSRVYVVDGGCTRAYMVDRKSRAIPSCCRSPCWKVRE